MDLISRQAAKRIIEDINTFVGGWRYLALEQIDELPTAEKKGKWIKGIDVPNRKPYVHLADALYCSVCHEEAYWDTDYGQQLFAYCPNCGADMREEN